MITNISSGLKKLHKDHLPFQRLLQKYILVALGIPISDSVSILTCLSRRRDEKQGTGDGTRKDSDADIGRCPKGITTSCYSSTAIAKGTFLYVVGKFNTDRVCWDFSLRQEGKNHIGFSMYVTFVYCIPTTCQVLLEALGKKR